MSAQSSVQPNTPSMEMATSNHSCSSLPAFLPETSQLPHSRCSSPSLHAQSSHVRSTTTANNNKRINGGMARQKRNSWMRSSVVRRAAAVVDEEVAALCEKSPFLNSLTTTEVALFHRLEVQLGEALGRGGFAEVYAVTRLDVQEAEDDDDDEARKRRKECQQYLTLHSGRPAYAIKFLRKNLLSKTREFQHAAIDLAVESKYLAALSHRNIIKIRGLALGGTNAFRTGKHDDYFIIMDHLQETLDHRMQRWQQRNEKGRSPPRHYFPRTLHYAHQIADALAYLHDKSIVYRDLKPQNLGFREGDVIQLFDFGLCRELPKPKGQCYRENLEDEETFHMSGVGTQRYMAPEIITTRQYNLKADVFSHAMVTLEMMTWKKPFSAYTPEEHKKCVAGLGMRPKLVLSEEETGDPQQQQQSDEKEKHSEVIVAQDWPSGLAELLQESWTQDVARRLTMQSVMDCLGTIVANFEENAAPQEPVNNCPPRHEETEVVLEFPSHFSPRHQLSEGSRHRHQLPPLSSTATMTLDDSDAWFGDRQSEASRSYQELTMTSASTTLHDSNSTQNTS